MHEVQARILDESSRFNVLECGRRFGKTTLGIRLIGMYAKSRGPAAWFAPTYKQLIEPWENIVERLRPVTKKLSIQDHRLILTNGNAIEFWSLDQPDSGRGRKYALAVIDEASIIRNLKDAWEQTIRPTLTDLQGDAWFLGTPKGRNYFHQLWTKGQDTGNGWRSWRFGTADNPYMPIDDIQAARIDLPQAVFDQEYLGIPADDAGNPFGLKAIRACVSTLSTSKPAHYGIDLAKSHDWTVVCGLDADGNVCHLDRWQSDWAATRNRILATIGQTPATADSTGVGDPIVEDLQRHRPQITGFKFTSHSKQQLMEGLASAIHTQTVHYPDGWLVHELESFEYEYRPTGVRYSAPDGMHDDGVCALALAVNGQRRRITPDIDLL